MALIIVCFFVCMILGIVVVSDVSTFKRLFGLEPVVRESLTVDDLSFYHKINRYVTNSSHADLLPKHNSRVERNSTVIMVAAENSDIVSKSAAAVHVHEEDISPNYDVHIFYYPWYGNPTYDSTYLHWNHQVLPHWKPEISARYPVGRRHQPPDDLGSSFYPRLGPYSSHDPSVIADHMRQIQQSGAGHLTITRVNFLK